MRVVPLLVAALLDLAGAGQVLSSMRPSARVGTTERGALGSGDDTLESFRHCVQRLRDTPNAARSLRAVLGYIERASAHPRSKICMWDPEFCEHVAPTPEARECLLAAGFVALETNDASGTPYLAHRRIPPRMLRAMALELKRQAAELEGGGGGAPPAPPPNASSALAKPRADAGVRREAERLGTGAPTAVAEAEQVEQIMGMITGIIKELERQIPGGTLRNETDGVLLEGEENSTAAESQAPVHFRIYRSPSFPGFPPGGGLPFMPGAGGGSADAEEDGDVPSLERKLKAAGLPAEAEEVAQRDLKRLRRMSPMHSEYSTLVEYLETIADLPWNRSSDASISLAAAEAQLAEDHFGMTKVKERILEFLAVAKLKGETKGSILCMHGPPGIGKTSLGKSIATALGRDFHRVSLGGVHTEAEVRGHRRTYVGAMPGLILQGIKKCGSNNCVIMLDEVDKLGRNSLNGDPSSALLEVLDPEQNHAFRDHFLNLPFNLSGVLFIATANELQPIPRPLRDRMEVIDMHGYTVEEKIEIARRHLLPKQLTTHGLEEAALSCDAPTFDAIIAGYTREAGVRELERQLAALCRAAATRVARLREGPDADANAADAADAADASKATDKPAAAAAAAAAARGKAAVGEGSGVVTLEQVEAVLGPVKFDAPKDRALQVSKPGVAIGLAYTPFGGDVLYIEASKMGGSGQVTITGQLGDVMKESARTALSWLRAAAPRLGLVDASSGAALAETDHVLNRTDVHLHFPEGAVSKDGPSAGVAIVTALTSLLTGRLVRNDVAMTGEVTLRGLVLPVGGVKEKVIGAHRAGVRMCILPARNEKDLLELPASVAAEMDFTFVTDVEQALEVALHPAEAAADPASSSTPPDGKGHGERAGRQRPRADVAVPGPAPAPSASAGPVSAAGRGVAPSRRARRGAVAAAGCVTRPSRRGAAAAAPVPSEADSAC